MRFEDFGVFVALLLALGFAFGFMAGNADASQPACPFEDSCRADYFDGAWHIIPLDPEDI